MEWKSNAKKSLALATLVPFALLSAASSEVSSTSTSFGEGFTLGGEGDGEWDGEGDRPTIQVEDGKFWGCMRVTRYGALPEEVEGVVGLAEALRVTTTWSFLGDKLPGEEVLFGDLEVSRAEDTGLRSAARALMSSADAVVESENALGVMQIRGETAVSANPFVDFESVDSERGEVWATTIQIDGGVSLETLEENYGLPFGTVSMDLNIEHLLTGLSGDGDNTLEPKAEGVSNDEVRIVNTVHRRDEAPAEDEDGFFVVLDPLIGDAAERAGCVPRF